MWDNFLLKVDKNQEILKTKKLLKVEYDPDRIIQHYYKQIHTTRRLLTVLKEIVTDKDVKRNAYAMFTIHINLKKMCQDWYRSTLTTWAKIKTHFSTEIQINNTNPVIMQQKEQTNAVLNYTGTERKL